MKISESIFLPWRWEEEESLINKQSAAGRHLKKRTVFGFQYETRPEAQFVYRIDRSSGHGLQEMIYQKQGWEPVCRRGGWLYFRKPYDPAQPEQAYRVYTAEGTDPIDEYLNALCKRLDKLRNLLLVLAFLMLLVPTDLVPGWSYRWVVLPLIIIIGVVKYAGAIRKYLGTEETGSYTKYH